MVKRAATIAALFVLTAAPASSVAADGDAATRKQRLAKSVRLGSFSSCRELVRYGRRHARRGAALDEGPPIGSPRPLMTPPPVAVSPGPLPRQPMAEGAPGSDQSSGGDSGTNVQEAGVDEPDLVKAGRGVVFASLSDRVVAVSSADGLRLLDTLELAGWGHQLLLRGDRLLAISHSGAYGDPGSTEPGAPDTIDSPDTVTQLTEIDVSDPAAMRVVRTERVRGHHVSSRLTGSTARVVVWSRPRAIGEPELRAQLRGWLPRRALRRAGKPGVRLRPVAGCRRVMRPATLSGVDLLTVLTIDMDRGLPAVDSDAVVGGGQTVYASKRALYVAQEKWSPSVPEDELLPGDHTQIHRFDASEDGATAYSSSGRVAGHLLNQFSMSEHEGVLRVAATRLMPSGSGDDSESSVSTLGRRGETLVELGRVDGLGKGERIYAVRFLGDVGYVVTFRQVDPLYTLDLATPERPRIAGELKVRGYSAYLHPIAEGLLLGVGQDATERGGLLGTQVSLFDVSDPAAPRRLHQLRLGNGSSEAEWDHHAFLWWAPAKLAVLPVEDWAGDGTSFAGAAGIHVDRAAGLAEVGRAAHSDGSSQAIVRRALVVDGRLVTVSDLGIEQNSLTDLNEEAWLAFPRAGEG